MKQKILALVMGFLYLIGTISGIGYSLWIGEYVTGIGVAVLGVMAYPVAKMYWQELNS